MTFASASQFHIYLPLTVGSFNSVLNLNLKEVVAALNQEKALVGDFSVFPNLRVNLHLEFYYTAFRQPQEHGTKVRCG